MSRILKAYETQFRGRLQHAGARRLDQGVKWLVTKARVLSSTKGISLAEALTAAYAELAQRCRPCPVKSTPAELQIFCDAGLGGLARWLRAAGYEANWEEGIDDDDLLRQASKLSATILTTDSMLMERRVIRDRIIPAFWLPPTLRIPEQLELVFRELSLSVRTPRCMACGGLLDRADKEAMRERIPPKTYRWLDEYFVCSRCGKLFWHGTHWRRIVRTLKVLEP